MKEPIVTPATLEAFSEALNGGKGDLDAWLECNNEAEVRAHIFATTQVAMEAEREVCAKLALAPENRNRITAERIAELIRARSNDGQSVVQKFCQIA